MTDQEREALAWLDGQEGIYENMRPGSLGYTFLVRIRTLKSMLAQPRLPEKASDAALRAMNDGYWIAAHGGLRKDDMAAIYRALRDHLTKPKTKTVWDVAVFGHVTRTVERLEHAIDDVREHGSHNAVIITPREVPAT